ncbi:hypothetical protein [Tropicimonas sp. IMCC34043]|uniref:hypothetical protein n=1 Tax=Tropicimonas sp. IMCC34043 TaxID=2248760 RepID=UPI000E260EC9|nr:hypothetical protein [Tropicimonas sp. IMCC34043]
MAAWNDSAEREGIGGVNGGRPEDNRGDRAAGNLLLRYWREVGPHGAGRLRGTIRDLSGAMLGAFETEQGLFALLHRLIGAKPQTRNDNDPEGPP